MATTTLYRCRLTPADCPAGTHPGYCTNHPWIELAPAETTDTPTTPRGDDTDHPTGPDPARTRPGRHTPAPPAWALRICPLDTLIPIPPTGLDIGRDTPRFTRLTGMADLDQISRHHARLTWQGDTLLLQDLGSTNGTYIAGRRITDPEPVTPGQLLRLAEDVDIELVDLDQEL